MQVIDGEVYPPTVRDVGADMHYPPHIPESERFAVGHEAFGLVPGLMMYATIWLREHNRVCDVLKEAHPDWDDERLFQTSRLILIGEFGGSSSQGITIRGSKQKPSLVTLLSHCEQEMSKEELHFGNHANAIEMTFTKAGDEEETSRFSEKGFLFFLDRIIWFHVDLHPFKNTHSAIMQILNIKICKKSATKVPLILKAAPACPGCKAWI